MITIRLPWFEGEKIQCQFYPHESNNKDESTNQRSNEFSTIQMMFKDMSFNIKITTIFRWLTR